jgi:ribosomal protein L29
MSTKNTLLLIKKYKTQQIHLAGIEEREAALNKELSELLNLRKEIACEEISKTNLIENALNEAGIENIYFPNQRGIPMWLQDDIKREVFVNGVRTDVSLNLETGELLLDGKPLEESITQI